MAETLEIPVLFCSQTGNAYDAAEKLASSLSTNLSTPTLTITSVATTLDDFLEIELRSPPNPNPSSTTTPNSGLMPRLFCVVASSYGVGQAPLGGYKFRELCDFVLSPDAPADVSTLWSGCTYAMLGLGDSKYTTFFHNPTALDGGLTKAGAMRVGPLGKADVSTETGTQADVIEKWSEDILEDLRLVLKQREADTKEQKVDDDDDINNDEEDRRVRGEMAKRTVGICKDLFPDWEDDTEIVERQKTGFPKKVLVGLIPVGLLLAKCCYSPRGKNDEL